MPANGKSIRDGTGADLRNGSVKGRDIARNTLGAANINESALGRVPTASRADNAAKLAGLDLTAIKKLVALRCPFGTREHAGACIESALRAERTWRQAWLIARGRPQARDPR